MSRDVGQDKKAGEGLSTTALSSDWTEHAWRTQFSQQRTLYQHKFIDYRSCAIDACRGDSKALWSKLRPLLEPKPSSNSTLAAEDLAQYFTWKISSTRASTATSPPPRILKTFPFWSCCCWIYGRRPSTKWRSFWRSRRPNTVIFIWLVKRAGDVLALVIAHMCNVSFTQFKIPDRCKKRDILRPLLKNRALHPNDPALYRPISNLSFVSQVAEMVANGRFAADAARHSLLPIVQIIQQKPAVIRCRRTSNSRWCSATTVRSCRRCTWLDRKRLKWSQSSCSSWLLRIWCHYFAVWCPSGIRSWSKDVPGVRRGRLPSHGKDAVPSIHWRHARLKAWLTDRTVVPQILSTLADYATDIIAWCAAKRLQLSANKTELMWFGSAAKHSKIPPESYHHALDLFPKVVCHGEYADGTDSSTLSLTHVLITAILFLSEHQGQ